MVNSDRPYTVDDNVRFINSTVNSVYELVALIPGSDIIMNYLKESYQHDPFRVVLELFLVFFAIKYMLAKRYKPNDNSVKLTNKVRNGHPLGKQLLFVCTIRIVCTSKVSKAYLPCLAHINRRLMNWLKNGIQSHWFLHYLPLTV